MDLSGYTPQFLKRCLERTEARTASDEEIDLAMAFLTQQEAKQLQANNQLEEEARIAEQERDQIRHNIQAHDEYHRKRREGENGPNHDDEGGQDAGQAWKLKS